MIDLGAMADDLPIFHPGTVWLVGAGPGHVGLLSLAALHALQSADVIVHDALIGEGILRLARPGAAREFVGKRGGRPSPTQGDITERLVELARDGKRVLRLKGGDPFVFGRGAEEAMGLVAAGIGFRVIPGMTAGLAGLALAGIPATSRDTNQAVTLVTGHGADGADKVDWRALAAAGTVLVLYMAMTRLPEIVPDLLAGGLDAATPAAVVQEATTPRERVHVSTLGRLIADIAAQDLQSPALIVIGRVAEYRALFADYREGLR